MVACNHDVLVVIKMSAYVHGCLFYGTHLHAF